MLLSVEWWNSLSWSRQMFLSLAIVSTFLLVVFVLLNLFWQEQESKEEANKISSKYELLLFFALGGWIGITLSYFNFHLSAIILAATLISGLIVLGQKLFRLLTKVHGVSKWQPTLEYTGEVLQSIPPNKNGRGKVTFRSGCGVHELNALTIGYELLAGAPIRIVEIVDENTVIVEPVLGPIRMTEHRNHFPNIRKS